MTTDATQGRVVERAEFVKVRIAGADYWGLWHEIASTDAETLHTACGILVSRTREFATTTRPADGLCSNCRRRPTSKRRYPKGPPRRRGAERAEGGE